MIASTSVALRRGLTAALALGAVLATATTAFAQDDGSDLDDIFGGDSEVEPDPDLEDEGDAETGEVGEAEAGDGAWSDIGSRWTMPRGTGLVAGYLEVNLSDSAVLEPVSIAPDAWYGATDEIAVGLVHSTYGATGFWGRVGDSLCLTGEDSGCPEFYRTAGLLGRYHLSDGPWVLAVDGGLLVRAFDPFVLGGKVGALVQHRIDKISLVTTPSFYFGMTERDGGNKEALSLPVSVLYDVSSQLAVGGQTGVILPFSDAGDLWALPLSLGARYAATDKIFVEGAFSFPFLAGGEFLPTGFDARVLTVGIGSLI